MKEAPAIDNSEKKTWDLWQVEPALTCNLKCVMCPWHKFRKETGREPIMDAGTWKELVPYLRRVKSVDFTGGGEPLMNVNLLDWIRTAKQNGCQTGFLTNGTLLNPEVSRELVHIGLDWLAVSMDSPEAGIYEQIRCGSDFAEVCGNVRFLTQLRESNRPLVTINWVMMEKNVERLEDAVRLASSLGVDRVRFKQCDVIRHDNGRGLALFAAAEDKKIKRYKKRLARARKIAAKLNMETMAHGFTPDEQPVCDQNPGKSLFIGYDGTVAPCMNLAMGGPSEFMGTPVTFPTDRYGSVLEKNLRELWESETCRKYKNTFEKRIRTYDKIMAGSDFGSSLLSLHRAFQEARRAMPAAPEGCGTCHHLYGI